MNENKNTGADNVTAGKLPDGWKMYDKYQIRHADGTPLKGKRYFVLRLDSDDPSEAARVSAAMSAYKGEAQSGNAAKLREAVKAVVDVGYPHNFQREAPHIRGYCYDITRAIEKCFAALASPPRNCDVGTEEEQEERFTKFCLKDRPCAAGGGVFCAFECPLNIIENCRLKWAQMPYESEVAK